MSGQVWEVTLDVRGERKVLAVTVFEASMRQAAAEVRAIKSQPDWQNGVRCVASRYLSEARS